MWVGVLDALESLLTESSDCYDHNWNSFMQADVLGQLLMTEKVEWVLVCLLLALVVLT